PAAAILAGHTPDDLAETVLLRLARGTGIDGLAAMDVVAGDLIRPLLHIRRADVQRFVLLEGLPTAGDPMNDDPAVRRVVVRHELLGVLERVADDPVGALARLADLARADAAVLDDIVARHRGQIRRVGPVRILPDGLLDDVPPAIARRLVRAAIADLVDTAPDAETVARVLALPAGSAISLPGPLEVTAAAGWRAIAPRSLPPSPMATLSIPGVAPWPAAAVTVQAITAETDPWRARPPAEANGQVALALPEAWTPPPADDDVARRPPGARAERMVLALPADAGPLRVRHRKSGDRVVTGGGTRTLQDVFVDAGVPRPVREIWPVVTTTDGRIVWVPGIVADEAMLRAGRAPPAVQLR
ncbi:MAG: tRNA lysidine(34) synthetase TilS, partial [Nitriliruptoraceae bacterium]